MELKRNDLVTVRMELTMRVLSVENDDVVCVEMNPDDADCNEFYVDRSQIVSVDGHSKVFDEEDEDDAANRSEFRRPMTIEQAVLALSDEERAKVLEELKKLADMRGKDGPS